MNPLHPGGRGGLTVSICARQVRSAPGFYWASNEPQRGVWHKYPPATVAALKANGADILKGTESNPRSLTDPSKGRVTVKAGAPYLNLIDPNHGMPAYTLKIFGNKTFNDTSQSPNYVNDAVATMEGFFACEYSNGLPQPPPQRSSDRCCAAADR